MNVTINKHFNAHSPFTDASNDEERAKVMRLKYPRACSNLEAGAEAFADMVAEVRKYKAWTFIGFASFEDFCRKELGKTISEVEDIVEGVRILGGNPTEEQAKQASRSQRAADLVKAGTHTQAEAAREIGISKQAVGKVISQPVAIKPQKVDRTKTPVIGLAKDPSRTAANIRAKMGENYANQLKALL